MNHGPVTIRLINPIPDLHIGPGWRPILEDAVRQLSQIGVTIHKGHRSHGAGLVLIMEEGPHHDERLAVYLEVEHRSLRTCESCGGPRNPEQQRQGNHMYTCETCGPTPESTAIFLHFVSAKIKQCGQ